MVKVYNCITTNKLSYVKKGSYFYKKLQNVLHFESNTTLLVVLFLTLNLLKNILKQRFLNANLEKSIDVKSDD